MMQQNFQNKPKSHLIQITDIARKKAMRRLLGSICLLIVALLLLLNVTARLKPSSATRKTIEINTSSSNGLTTVATTRANTNNSTSINIKAPAATGANTESSTTIATMPKQSSATLATTKQLGTQQESSAKAAPTIAQATEATNDTTNKISTPETPPTTATDETLPKLNPQIISEAHAKPKLTPMEILNGASADEEPAPASFFVQLISSNNKAHIVQIQHQLAQHGIHANMQKTQKHNIVTYRLRVGPFHSQEQADSKLDEINQHLEE